VNKIPLSAFLFVHGQVYKQQQGGEIVAVIFGENALSDQSLNNLFTYIDDMKKKFAWGTNLHIWPPTLTITPGVVLTHNLPEQMTDEIFAELVARGNLPFQPKDRIMMFYAWCAGSNITWHSDYLDKHSMTIYLSKNWNPNHGGYFCWREWDESLPRHSYGAPPEQCKMQLPKYNNFVYMTDAEWHTTTITAPSAPPRLSLQMFFSGDNQ
jgi:hypothetical protein